MVEPAGILGGRRHRPVREETGKLVAVLPVNELEHLSS